MKTRNVLSALIGLWFIIAPWAVGFSDHSGAVWVSLIFGIVQLLVSLWAYGKSGWNVWQNWVTVITGILFIILPFSSSLSSGETWASVILGLLTVIFSFWNLGSKE
jgi:hypothetical protein